MIWIASYDAATIEAMHLKNPETNHVLHIEDAVLWREELWVLLLHGHTRVKNAGLNEHRKQAEAETARSPYPVSGRCACSPTASSPPRGSASPS